MVTGMRYYPEEQGNVSALVQIFNAIPSMPFSAPEYGDVPFGDTLYFNICFLSMINYRVSLNGTSPIVTLEGQFRKAGLGRGLQCRVDISMLLYCNIFLRHSGTKPKIK